MKTQALVKVGLNGKKKSLIFFRPNFFSIDVEHAHDDILSIAKQRCNEIAHEQGRPWLQYWSSSGNQINCPEGAVKLPADIWVCKLSGEMCNLQAAITLSKKDLFFKHCTAPEKRKTSILDSIENGKYDGFHHVPGRYLCVGCESKGGKKETFYYHYPWEFAELDFALGLTFEETRALLSILGIPVNRVNCPLCATCCKELAVSLSPKLADSLHVVYTELNVRAKHKNPIA